MAAAPSTLRPTPRRRRARFAESLLALLALGLATLAHAPPVCADGLADEAELEFQIGAERYQAGDFTGALEHFLTSNRLVANRNVVFNVARTYEQMHRYADAHRYYVDALQGETNPQTLSDIRAAIARLAPNVAVLDIETDPPGATIFLNRRDLGSRGRAPRPLAIPPGRYTVLTELEGYEPAQSELLDARLGAVTPVRLTLVRVIGTVHVDGPPGALVRFDDERANPICTAPCDAEIPPGQHVMYVQREGYQVYTHQVNVPAHGSVIVRPQLAAVTGSIVVSADEQNATVEVDGRTVGFTPVVVPNVPVGHRLVRVTLRGFTPVEREVEVRAAEQTDLAELRLVPVREVTAASRVAESLEDAPSSVSIITPQELHAFAFPTIAEALRGVRGIYLSNDRSYWSVGIRGLGQPNDYGNRLLVLADGMPLNDDVLYSSYIGYDGRTDLGDVERIEVVRGPGSLLYGTGALSGVVNLVQRGRDEPTSVHANISTYDNSVYRARAGFNLRLGRDAGVWASVAGARSDGVNSTVNVGDPSMGAVVPTAVSQVDAMHSATINGRAWWGPLTLQAFWTSREQVIPTGTYGTAVGDTRTRYTDTRGMFELRFEPRLSPQVQLLTRLYGNIYTFDGGYAYSASMPPTVNDASPLGSFNHEYYQGTWGGLEARLAWTPLHDLRVTLGSDVQLHPDVTMVGYSPSPSMPSAMDPSTQYLNEHHSFSQFAAYALAEWSVTRWFRISAGARVDAYFYGSEIPNPFAPSVNPRVALIFRPVTGGTLKFLGGRAFRAPSMYEYFYNDGGITQARSVNINPLSPETIYTGEVEYSQRFLQDWVVVAAAHVSLLENTIETAGDGSSMNLLHYENSPVPIVTSGGEIELRREFRQGWLLGASYGFLIAQNLHADASVPNADAINSDPRLTNAPMHLASLRAIVPLIQNIVSAAVRLTAESPRRSEFSYADSTGTVVHGIDTPWYALADLVLSGNVPRFNVRWAAGIYNLFDTHYYYPVSVSSASISALQPGRTFMASLTVTF